MHAVYVGRENNDAVCIVANDTDIYLSLINIPHHVHSHLYFRQGKTKDKDGVNYHDICAIAVHLGKEICQILPCFHTLTGSDFTNLFFSRSKIKAVKKMLETSKSHKLLLSLLSGQPNIEEVTNLVSHIVYNRPYKEKSMGELRYNMLKTKRKTKKKKEKKYNTGKDLLPDHCSLKMKILRTSSVHTLHNILFEFSYV